MTFSVHLLPALKEQIQQMAEAEDRSLNAQIIHLVKKGLEAEQQEQKRKG